MISERTISKGFSALWGELFPLLTANFMRVFNRAYVVRLTDFSGSACRPIPLGAELDHPDLVAELSFHIARISHEQRLSVDEVFDTPASRNEAIAASQRIIALYEGAKPTQTVSLSDVEQEEAKYLGHNYVKFLRNEEGEIEFSPEIPGAGVLGPCQGDLSVGSTLFEIKTVHRNFQSKDLKQLILYLALQAATGDRRWLYGGLFNPRQAVSCRFEVNPFVGRLSGGRAPLEVFNDLVNGISRDALNDSVF